MNMLLKYVSSLMNEFDLIDLYVRFIDRHINIFKKLEYWNVMGLNDSFEGVAKKHRPRPKAYRVRTISTFIILKTK